MIKNYFKIALRNLWRHRGFSFLNISGLAIGMTAGFLILLYVGFELSYDTMHSKGDRIYRVVADINTPSEKIEADRPAWPVSPNLKQEFPEVTDAVRLADMEMLVRRENIKFVETEAVAADSSFFRIFDFKLLEGDRATVLKDPYSLVLSQTTAKKYFGDVNPVGQTLNILEEKFPARVTGIMEDIPENSHIKADILLSMTTLTQDLQKGADEQWGNYYPVHYILTTSGQNPDQLQAKFPDFLERKNGQGMKESQMAVTLYLEPLQEVYLHSKRSSFGGSISNVYVFSMVAVFILLIACINFINLTTARSVERAKEVGIRKVIGAEKKQLFFQFIGESVIISLFAFVLTILLSALVLPYFNNLAGKIVSQGIFSSPLNILFLFVISLTIGVLAGIYPAVVLTSFKPVIVLKGRFSSGTRGVLLRKGLVIAQFTISIILIIGTIVIYNQMEFMRNQELGFNKDQTIVLETGSKPAQKVLQQTVEQLPGVQSTSLAASVPGGGNASAYSEIENKNGDLQIANIDLYFVDEDYIPQFDLKVLAGRAFSKDFATDSTQAMVINERTVQLLGYSSPEEAVGARFKQWGREGQVIGVVKDFHFRSLQQPIQPLTMRLEPRQTGLVAVKVGSENIEKTVEAIKSNWQTILPDQPFSYYFMDEFFDRQYRTEERFGKLFLNFSVLAIFIACLGLLGLASYSTIQRRREIGIRKIIGASVSGIVNLLSVEFLKLVGIAFLIATPVAWYAMDRWLEDFAYRIDISWWVFLSAGMAAMLIALITVGFHAIKAALEKPCDEFKDGLNTKGMFKNYFKTAYRNLLKHKGFSFINVAGLTFGLTACLLIGLFVWDEQQFDKFIPEGERVYRVYQQFTTPEIIENTPRTPPMFGPTLPQEFAEAEQSVRVMEILSRNLFEASDKQFYEQGGVYVDSNFFQLFPLPFRWGSPATALADPASIVISGELSERYFGGGNPVGKEILVEKQPYQVKGVFEKNPKFHLKLDYILPMSATQLPAVQMESWGWNQFNTYVKLKPGTNAKALEVKFQKVVNQKNPPDPNDAVNQYKPFLQSLTDVHLHSADFKYDMAVRGNITYIRALSIIAIFILVIACFNFVNLATAKSLQRAKEVGVRKTIGASRKQLMGQFVIETIQLTLVSILLALGLVALLLPWLNEFAEKQISFSLFANPVVLLLLLALTLLTGVLAGFYPALVLSGFHPVKVLKGSAVNNAGSGKTPWLRHSLVVGQFALSVLLIISALVVYRQVEYMNTKDLGFNNEEIMFFPMRGENMFENYATFKSELERLPGVSSVSVGYGFPGDMVAGDQIIVPREGEQLRHPVTQLLVDHDYVKTLGLELVAGRDFSKEMKTDLDKAFLINETAVRDLGFGTPEKALGQALHWGEWGASHPDSLKKGQIIGVVKDFHFKSLYDRVEPAVLQIFPGAYWKVAVKMETAALSGTLDHVKGVWNQFAPEYPLEYIFLDESFDKMYKAEDKLKLLLWIFTAVAIFVGCLGLFGLAAYAAERRTKEIGIRKVLGASVQNIVVLLSGDFVKLVLVAVLIASPIAWYFMNDWLLDFAYRINISWWIFTLAGIAAVFIALITVGFHALKAAFRNPVKNLRTE